MPNPADSEDQHTQPAAEGESFKDILSQFEQSHSHKPEEGSRRIEATVVTLTADSILLDIGFKTEGILPLTALRPGETVKPGDKLLVSVKGRNTEGYYEVALGKISRPIDWPSLEQAFNEKATIVGTSPPQSRAASASMWACALLCRLHAAACAMPLRWKNSSDRRFVAASPSSMLPKKM